MKKGDKKSTDEQKQLMLKLYKEGFGFSEIGKKIGRDPTTILYWVRKKGLYNPQRKLLSLKQQKGFNSKPIEKGAKEEVKKEKEKKELEKLEKEERERIEKLKLCIKCKKPKSESWKLTNFCSLNCWNEANSKEEKKWLQW